MMYFLTPKLGVYIHPGVQKKLRKFIGVLGTIGYVDATTLDRGRKPQDGFRRVFRHLRCHRDIQHRKRRLGHVGSWPTFDRVVSRICHWTSDTSSKVKPGMMFYDAICLP